LVFGDFHLGMILIEKGKYYESVHNEKLTGSEIGLQLAYLEFLNDIIASLKKNSKEFNNTEIQ
jgi:hypothetical protein